jgi:peptide/nickel transport system permease protein
VIVFALRRAAITIPVLLGVTLITYALINAAPGNAVTMLADPLATEENRRAMEHALGLDAPIWVRYVLWLGQILTGNFGYSYVSNQPVLPLMLSHLPATLELMAAALLIAYVVGIPLGVFVAVRQYSWYDYVTTFFAFVGISTPSFFLGLVLIYVFALQLNWLPPSGQYTLGGSRSLGDLLTHLVMPAAILALNYLAITVRYVRGSVLEVLGQDYVRTARSKGLRERLVLYRHALRNALLPIITLAGLQVPSLFAGAVITEQVFAWPGMGQFAIQAIGARDYPVLMSVTFVSATLVVVGNLVADLLYGVADPRVRLS